MGVIPLTTFLNNVKDILYKKSPGTALFLDFVSRKEMGMPFTESLLKKPDKLVDIIQKAYPDKYSVAFIYDLIVKIIASKLGKLDAVEEVKKALSNGCASFVRLLKENGVNGSLNEAVCGLNQANSYEGSVASLS